MRCISCNKTLVEEDIEMAKDKAKSLEEQGVDVSDWLQEYCSECLLESVQILTDPQNLCIASWHLIYNSVTSKRP